MPLSLYSEMKGRLCLRIRDPRAQQSVANIPCHTTVERPRTWVVCHEIKIVASNYSTVRDFLIWIGLLAGLIWVCTRLYQSMWVQSSGRGKLFHNFYQQYLSSIYCVYPECSTLCPLYATNALAAKLLLVLYFPYLQFRARPKFGIFDF